MAARRRPGWDISDAQARAEFIRRNGPSDPAYVEDQIHTGYIRDDLALTRAEYRRQQTHQPHPARRQRRPTGPDWKQLSANDKD